MEITNLDELITSIAQSLKPGFTELIGRLSLAECNEEINTLINGSGNAQTASHGSLLRCLLLIFHRQTTLACKIKADLEKEVELLKVQNASLLHEAGTASRKALHYLEDLHSAESELCSQKEELFRLRSENLTTVSSYSRCDSGFSDSSSVDEESRLHPPQMVQSFPTKPLSLGLQSSATPLSTDRDSNDLTSHISDSDFEETVRLSSRFSVPSLSHTDFDTQVNRRRGVDCNTAPPSTAQRPEAQESNHLFTNANSVLPLSERKPKSPRFKELTFLAEDMSIFDPDNSDQHIDDYLRELDMRLVDLPHASDRERILFLQKTSSRAVKKFIQTQPRSVQDNYTQLRQAMTEEFSSAVDEIDGIVAALQIKHSRLENPRDFYQRLRHTYFQGRNAPGLEENPQFKSMFLRNLHPSIRVHVALMTLKGIPSMHELRKITIAVWETAVTSKIIARPSEPASSNPVVSHRVSPQKHPSHNRSRGGVKRQQGVQKRNRHVPQLRRDGHAQNRSCRRPYSEILTQNHDVHSDRSDGDAHSDISDSDRHSQDFSDGDNASDRLSVSHYQERYSPEPRTNHRRSRARS